MKYSSLYKILFEGVEESEEFIKSLTLGDVVDIANLAAVLSSNMDAGVRLNDDGVVEHGDGYRFGYDITVYGRDENGIVNKTWDGQKYFYIDRENGDIYSGDKVDNINKLVPLNEGIKNPKEKVYKALVHDIKNAVQIGLIYITLSPEEIKELSVGSSN